jgi:hypothetical protein
MGDEPASPLLPQAVSSMASTAAIAMPERGAVCVMGLVSCIHFFLKRFH